MQVLKRTRLPAALGEILRLALQPHRHGELASRVQGRRLTGLAAASLQHGIPGYVKRALADTPGLAPSALGALADVADVVDAALRVHLAILQELPILRSSLEAAGVSPVVLKGPVLTEVHGRADLRAYSDLDVLVAPQSFPFALRALEARGGRALVPSWAELARVRAGELSIAMPSGVTVDLHWHLLNDQRLRRTFSVPTSSLLERVQPVQVNGVGVQTLDPIDMVLHLGLHSCMSGNDRLLWLKDIERAVATVALDWDTLIRRARACRVGLPVAIGLQRSRDVLGAPVPGGIIGELAQGRLWPGLSRLSGRLAPTERAAGSGSGSVDRLVSRATRHTFRHSLWELGRKSKAGLSSNGELTSPDVLGARTAYLEAVASGSLDPSAAEN